MRAQWQRRLGLSHPRRCAGGEDDGGNHARMAHLIHAAVRVFMRACKHTRALRRILDLARVPAYTCRLFPFPRSPAPAIVLASLSDTTGICGCGNS